MEDESSREQPPATPEASQDVFDALHERFGFIETDELRAIRQYATEAFKLNNTETANALIIEYQLRGEELVSSLEGSEYMRGQIGLIVAKATLHRDTGNCEAFLIDVADAKEYAANIHEEDAVPLLERMPSIEIARILSMYGDDFGFDEQTVAEITAIPYKEAFEIAYSYLTQAGLDADDILSAFME